MFTYMTITDFRKDAAQATERVRQDHVPMLLTQGSKEPLVLMALSDFNGFTETAYLMKNARTHKELTRAINEDRAGRKNYIKKSLDDLNALAPDA